MDTISICIISLFTAHRKYVHTQSSELLFLLCPKVLHSPVCWFCGKFYQISVPQDLVGAPSEEAEMLSPYCLVFYISVLALCWISTMFSFHKWGEWLRAVKLPQGIMQYCKIWLSLFLVPYLIVAHKLKLLSTSTKKRCWGCHQCILTG